MRPLLALSITLSLAVAAAAQLPPGSHTAAPDEHMIEWPAGLGTGTLRKAVGLFWDNVDQLAAVGLRGTTTGLAMAPAITPSISLLDPGAQVVDVVTLTRAGLPGLQNRDALLMTALGYDLLFAATDASGAMHVVPVAHPGWLRASQLTALADATGIDVVARSMAGNVVLRTRYDYATAAFTPMGSLPFGQQVRDLCLVDYDGDSINDVAVLTDSALGIYSVGGALLHSVALAHSGGAVDLAPDLVERDQLALLRRNAGDDGWEVVHIGNGTSEPGVAVSIDGDFSLVGMTSGDLDGDGDFDLAVQDAGTSVRIVENTGASPHFTAGPLLTIGNVGGVQSPAGARDYDYDGAADLLVPLAGGDGKSYLVLDKGLAAVIDAQAPVFGDIFGDPSFYEQNGTFVLWLVIPDYLTAFDKIAITAYTAPEGGDAAYVRDLIADNRSAPGQLAVDIPEIPEGSIEHPNILYLKVQFYDSTEAAPPQKPIFLTGGTVKNDAGYYSMTYLEHPSRKLPGATTKKIKQNSNPGRIWIGGYVAQSFLPPIE
jgi:hypothetical protein